MLKDEDRGHIYMFSSGFFYDLFKDLNKKESAII